MKVHLVWIEEREKTIEAETVEEAKQKWENGEIDFGKDIYVGDCDLMEAYEERE